METVKRIGAIEIYQADGKFGILDTSTQDDSGPRYKSLARAEQVAVDMDAENQRIAAYENSHK